MTESGRRRGTSWRDCASSRASEQYTAFARLPPARSLHLPASRVGSVVPELTSMTSFDDRYRLLKCVALGGGIRTHNAQETSTGRPVMVHILDGAEPDAVEQLRQQVGALPVPDRSRILEMTPTAGGFAIVSEFLAGLTTFPQWLGARVPVPRSHHPGRNRRRRRPLRPGAAERPRAS